MFLTIKSEKDDVANQIHILQNVYTKLSLHPHYQQEIHHFQILLDLAKVHLGQLQSLSSIQYGRNATVKITLYLDANMRIRNHFAKKEKQAKRLLNYVRGEFDYKEVTQCFSKIGNVLDKIHSDLLSLQKQNIKDSMREQVVKIIQTSDS